MLREVYGMETHKTVPRRFDWRLPGVGIGSPSLVLLVPSLDAVEPLHAFLLMLVAVAGVVLLYAAVGLGRGLRDRFYETVTGHPWKSE